MKLLSRTKHVSQAVRPSLVAAVTLSAVASLAVLTWSTAGQALPRAPAEAATVGAPAAPVQPARVSGEVMVLLATQGDGGRSIDAAIGPLLQLGKPPFNAYSHWKLLDRKTVSLDRGKSTTFAVANGRSLQLTYAGVTADRRFRVSAAMLREDGSSLQKVNVVAATQEPFFLAGQKYQGGTLFIGITVKP